MVLEKGPRAVCTLGKCSGLYGAGEGTKGCVHARQALYPLHFSPHTGTSTITMERGRKSTLVERGKETKQLKEG